MLQNDREKKIKFRIHPFEKKKRVSRLTNRRSEISLENLYKLCLLSYYRGHLVSFSNTTPKVYFMGNYGYLDARHGRHILDTGWYLPLTTQKSNDFPRENVLIEPFLGYKFDISRSLPGYPASRIVKIVMVFLTKPILG